MNTIRTQATAYEQDNRREWSMRETARLLGISVEELYQREQCTLKLPLGIFTKNHLLYVQPDFAALRPTRRRYWWSRLQRWFRGE